MNGPHSGIFPSNLIGNPAAIRGLVGIGRAGGPGRWRGAAGFTGAFDGGTCTVRARPRRKYAKLSYAGWRTELVSTSARLEK